MSKPKQEILLSKIADVQIFKLGTTANEINSFCELIHEAMQIYADQEAIAYANWLSNQVVAGRTTEKLFKDYKKAIGEPSVQHER